MVKSQLTHNSNEFQWFHMVLYAPIIVLAQSHMSITLLLANSSHCEYYYRLYIPNCCLRPHVWSNSHVSSCIFGKTAIFVAQTIMIAASIMVCW